MSRRALRSRRQPESLDLRTLVIAEVVCLLTWVITGAGVALFPALVAGFGLVVVAARPDGGAPQPRRRVG
jgi:hypothetical protein